MLICGESNVGEGSRTTNSQSSSTRVIDQGSCENKGVATNAIVEKQKIEVVIARMIGTHSLKESVEVQGPTVTLGRILHACVIMLISLELECDISKKCRVL